MTWICDIITGWPPHGSEEWRGGQAARIAVETVTEWVRENPDFRIKVVFSCVDQKMYQYISTLLHTEFQEVK